MTLLILGLVLWWVLHLAPVFSTGLQQRLSGAIGTGPSKGVTALSILGSVALMTIGYQSADTDVLWVAPGFLWHLNNLLMIIAILFFIAGSFPSHIRRAIRHPQLIGTKVWALAHLLVNGDVASVVLFGGILAWAVIAMIGSNRRDGPRGPKPEATMVGLGLHVGVTAVLTVVVIMLHIHVGGVSPVLG